MSIAAVLILLAAASVCRIYLWRAAHQPAPVMESTSHACAAPPSTPAAPRPTPSGGGCPEQLLPHPAASAPAFTEDDLISFGLALEASDDPRIELRADH
jgi:hypothetical protein